MIRRAEPAVVLIFQERDGTRSPLTRAEILQVASGPATYSYRRLRKYGYGLLLFGLLALTFGFISLVRIVVWILGLGTIKAPSAPVAIGGCLALAGIALVIASVCYLVRARRFDGKVEHLLALADEFAEVRMDARHQFKKLNTRRTKLRGSQTAIAKEADRASDLIEETEIEMSNILHTARDKAKRTKYQK